MKKFFSLVLALVMALSLTTVAWGAPVNVANIDDLKDAIDTNATEINVTTAIPIAEDISLSNVTVTTSVVEPFNVTAGTLTLGAGVVINANDAIFEVSGTGKVVIDGAVLNVTNGNYCAVCAKNGGTIELKSGSINQSGVDKVTVSIKGAGASLVMSGGTITSGNSSALIAYEGGTATISGGTVTSANSYAAYACDGGSITVSGGTVTNDVDDKPALVASKTYGTTGGSVTVKSGTVKGVKAHEDSSSTAVIEGGNITGPVSAANDATLSVSGGTFATDVSEYVAAGYRLVNGTVAAVPANTTGVVGGYEGMFTTAGATRQAVTNLTKTPAVAPLDVDEDGYYNRVGDRLGSIEYYTLNLGGAVAQNYYQVNTVDDADLIIYVGDSKTPYMYLANEPAGGFTYLTGAAAFNNFGKACGQFKWAAVDTTKTYYAYDGKVYMADPAGAVNLMIGTSFIQATDVTANGSWVAHSPVYTQDKTGAVTAVKCANCPASAVIVANYAALPNTVKAAGTYFNVPGSASKMFYWVDGIVVDTDTKVESADTFDAGIAMYVGMSVMAAAGSAVVIGKKKD